MTDQETPLHFYSQARRELVHHVPVGARRILDVSCGQGFVGAALRWERGAETVGIESDPESASIARGHLSEVVVGDVETLDLPFEDGAFDCIIAADTLRRSADAGRLLAKLKRVLRPGGAILATLPNIRHLGLLQKLVEGRWDYAERFVDPAALMDLFRSAGFDPRLAEIRDPDYARVDLRKLPPATNLEAGRLVFRDATPAEIEPLISSQFMVTGTLGAPQARIPAGPPVVSIIVPVFNNRRYTADCLEAIFTVGDRTPFEVIVVDDASSDDTVPWLHAQPFPVKLVQHPQNRGFAASCNDGAKAAEGRYVLFLNNDTQVLPGWLDTLVAAAEADPAIGLAGSLQIFPDSGRVQQCGIVCGENATIYSLHANKLPANHPAINRPREFPFLAGSCVLLEREFFFTLGGFDEGYLNSCEDIDLCLKVREAGRKVWYCPASRLYHYESKTVSGHPKGGPNYQLLLERWRHRLVRDDERYLLEDAAWMAALGGGKAS